jgi:hypothetical protein
MNRFGSLCKPLMWFMALVLAAFVAGCGGGDDGVGSGLGPTGAVCAGAACVPLGTAGNYVILSKSGISTVPTSAVTGNLGVSPAAATAITQFSLTADASNVFSTSSQVTGRLFAADYAAPTPSNLTTAVLNMENAYTLAAGQPAGPCPGAGALGGLTLAPGVYTCALNVGIATATNLVLNGPATGVWVFQITGTLTQAAATQVQLTGGALPQNVFWQVSGNVDIGTTALMQGVILGKTLINLQANATENGRLLAQTAVTLNQNTVTQP